MAYSVFKSNLFRKKTSNKTHKISTKSSIKSEFKNDFKQASYNRDSVEVTTKILLEQIQFAKQLKLSSIKNTKTFASGLHQSKFRGRGMDYQESRIYQPGDDVRSMDWKITARTDKVYTKIFAEEKQRPTFIIVDTNQSMRFGTKIQFKSVLAAKLASLLGWVTVNAGDKIGGMTFGVNGIHSQKPQSGKLGMMKWMTHLVDSNKVNSNVFGNSHGKNNNENDITNYRAANKRQTCYLDETIKQLRGICSPGSLIIIISDFYHLGDNIKQQLSLLSKHNDILALFVCDEFEFNEPAHTQYEVYEQSQQKTIDMQNTQVQKEFASFQKQHLQTLKSTMSQLNISVIPIQTDDNAVQKLKNSINNSSHAFEHWSNNLKNHE